MKKRRQRLTLMIKIRSIIFWIYLGTISLLYSIFGLLLYPLGEKLRHKLITTSWTYLINLGFVFISGIRYKVQNKENIKLVKGAAVIASNHQSLYETFIFNLIFPQHVWILKKELLKIPCFGWTLSTVSPIAIDRSKRTQSIRQITEQGKDRVGKGFWIMSFPEGTRVSPRVVKPFKVGAGLLAGNLEIPVLPVCHNAGYVIPKNSFWLYPGTVDIVIGEPISSTGKSREQLTDEIEAWVRQHLPSING